MNSQKITIAILATLSAASLALADDFKTIDGKEYKNVTVSRVEPDGLVLKTKSGISKVYFTELPQDVQQRFHYNAQQAAQFTNQAIEEVRRTQQQKIEADNKRAAEIAKNLEQVRKHEEADMQRQHEAEMQRQQLKAQPQQFRTQPAYSQSQEGIPEHTYELTQDYKIDFGGVTIRFRRGERYHGRILVDHAEIDRDGRSYNVPSGILRPADMQRQRLEAEQQRQVQTQPTYSRSQEGIPEHTYELTQDYKIDFGGVTIRFRRGERYHGRILVDHAEIDRDGRSYNVPSGILRRVN
jgi:hypothetical protein